MDYKHRVPGHRGRRRGRFKRKAVWAALAFTVAAILVLWTILHGGSTPEPEGPRTRQLQVPQVSPPTKAQEKQPGGPETGVARKSEPEKQVEAPAKPAEPRFSFYKILPEKEVIIPESEIRAIKREETLTQAPSGQSYLLQAGSFSNLQDAEKLKAQLSKLRVKSKIESVKIENAVWHRVKIGPFSSLVDADKVRSYLRSNQIDSVVQKTKGK